MATSVEGKIPSFIREGEVEFGNIQPNDPEDSSRSKLIIASYNIRYAVGQFLISSGLLRKAGFNPPGKRSEKVGKNIRSAARLFSEGLLLSSDAVFDERQADSGRCKHFFGISEI